MNIKEQVNFKGKFADSSSNHIVIAGMGGSGVSGRIFSELCSEKKISVVDSYNLPGFVNKDDYLVCVSYSGNTEETLSVAKQAKERGIKVHAITSGGKLSQIADEIITVPSGLQPRQALGYLLMPLINTFIPISDAERKNILKALDLVNPDEARNMAKQIVDSGKIPYIVSWEPFSALSYRAKTQFNENSKLPAISHTLSEQNHNELVPLAVNKNYSDRFFFISIDGSENSRNQLRMKIMTELAGIEFHHLISKGETYLSRYFYLVHFIDLLTYHAGIFGKFDPENVSILENLKKELSRFN
jgi:glucose/mannose-6-phosphate isomerase